MIYKDFFLNLRLICRLFGKDLPNKSHRLSVRAHRGFHWKMNDLQIALLLMWHFVYLWETMDNHFFSNVSLPLLLTVYSDEERTSLEQYVTQLPGLICIFRAWISLPALKPPPAPKDAPWDSSGTPTITSDSHFISFFPVWIYLLIIRWV